MYEEICISGKGFSIEIQKLTWLYLHDRCPQRHSDTSLWVVLRADDSEMIIESQKCFAEPQILFAQQYVASLPIWEMQDATGYVKGRIPGFMGMPIATRLF